MKGLFVFLALALVATASARTIEEKDTKGLIGDALTLIRCIENVLESTENNINNIKNIINGIDDMLESNKEKLRECNAIGGDNPSIIDQLETAQCTILLAESFRDEVKASIDSLVNSLNELVATGSKLGACF